MNHTQPPQTSTYLTLSGSMDVKTSDKLPLALYPYHHPSDRQSHNQRRKATSAYRMKPHPSHLILNSEEQTANTHPHMVTVLILHCTCAQ